MCWEIPTASDQEHRLRAIEEKLDRLLSERGQPREVLKGQPARPEDVPLDEEDRRKAAIWERLGRDGFIGRFDADPVAQAGRAFRAARGDLESPADGSSVRPP